MKSIFEILRYTHGLGGLYLGITVSSVLVALTGIAIPFVISSATDIMVDVVGGQAVDVWRVISLAGLLFVFDLSNTVIRNIGGFWGDMMAARLREQLSSVYYQHLLSLPQSYFDNELTGKIINRLNRAISELSSFLNMFANNLFQMLLTIVVTVVIVAIHSWELALLTVIMYPLFMWLTALTSKRWSKLQNQKNLEIDIASGRFAEVISQIRVVKSFTHEAIEHRLFAKRFAKTIDITRNQSTYWHRMDVLRGSALSLIFFGIYAFIFVQTFNQHFTIGTMVLLITLINGLRAPLFSMSFFVDSFQKAVTGSKDVLEVLRIIPTAETYDRQIKPRSVTGKIEFSDVSFAYEQDEKSVLRNLNFTIQPGEHMAIVSESGGGKTTMTNLLNRFYEVSSGKILIDDIDISTIKPQDIRRNIAMVFQEPVLFSGTIKENIVYGKPGASQVEVVEASKSANAEEFIDKLRKGYDTEIGERGLKLSGGQKQRIAIARAILKDAPLLILDEATSALDSRSERLVQGALDRLMKGRTTIIIAHRLSTIASVDRIITIKNGRIDEIGTPDDLAQTDGIYATLLRLQQTAGRDSKEKLAKFGISAND